MNRRNFLGRSLGVLLGSVVAGKAVSETIKNGQGPFNNHSRYNARQINEGLRTNMFKEGDVISAEKLNKLAAFRRAYPMHKFQEK